MSNETLPASTGSGRGPGKWFVAISLISLAAVPPRFIDLDKLSFYADEELTSLAARALAEGAQPEMPSGMAYRRALPYSALAAGSAMVFGVDREMSYRVPSAVFGAAVVPVTYLVGRMLVGPVPGLAAAGLMAVSEWHLVFSRQARMYSPFLLAYLLTALFLWQWVSRGGTSRLFWAIVAYGFAATLHPLAVFAIQFAILPRLLLKRTAVSMAPILGFSVCAVVLGLGYDRFFVAPPYNQWPYPPPLDPGASSSALDWLGDVAPLTWGLALVGGLLGAMVARGLLPRSRGDGTSGLPKALTVFGVAVLGGLLGSTGQLFGLLTFGAVLFALVPPKPLLDSTTGLVAIVALFLLSGAHLLLAVLQYGPRAAAVGFLTFPFPYVFLLGQQFGALVGLFALAVIGVAAMGHRKDLAGLRASILAVLLPLAAMGMVSRWGGTRYVFTVYPFLLISGSAVLVALVRSAVGKVSQRRSAVAVAGIVTIVIASGLVGGHGIPQTLKVIRLDHGDPTNETTHMYPIRPDHAGPGEFVRDAMRPGDVIVAEDPFQQFWYIGRVDFWLRSPRDAWGFVYEAEAETLRDTYVNSELLLDPQAMLARNADHRTWVITSAETFWGRDRYLSDDQRAWLEEIETSLEPAYVGRDELTRVYCLNCSARAAEDVEASGAPPSGG